MLDVCNSLIVNCIHYLDNHSHVERLRKSPANAEPVLVARSFWGAPTSNCLYARWYYRNTAALISALMFAIIPLMKTHPPTFMGKATTDPRLLLNGTKNRLVNYSLYRENCHLRGSTFSLRWSVRNIKGEEKFFNAPLTYDCKCK